MKRLIGRHLRVLANRLDPAPSPKFSLTFTSTPLMASDDLKRAARLHGMRGY